MRRGAVTVVALATALIAACTGGDGGNGGEAGTSAPASAGSGLDEVETVASGLEVPWALAFVDERTILVTERPGRVRVVRDGRLQPDPVLELTVVEGGEGGLLGIALHPRFPDERFAYLYYTHAQGNRVSRFPVLDDLRFGDEEVLLAGIPAARLHDGGGVAFGPDGMLYVATGDARRPERAADPSSVAGKILRLRPDGGVPADNPLGRDSPVFSYGHRNPQALDWDAGGRLYASEHGPTGEFGMCCHDEVNLIRGGAFYGWPFMAGRAEADDGSPPAEPVAPVATSGTDTWAPAGLAVHEPPGGPKSLLVAALGSGRLLRFVVDGDDPAAAGEAETALDGMGRLRAVAIGPDGCLYLTTSNTDGRGDPAAGDDRILRSCFADSP